MSGANELQYVAILNDVNLAHLCHYNGTRSMTDGVLLMKMRMKRRRSVQVLEIVHKQIETHFLSISNSI